MDAGAEPFPRTFLCADGGMRLDVFLATLLAPEAVSRMQVQRSIRAGLVRVDGRVGKGGERLPAGARVEVAALAEGQPAPLQPEPIPLHVVYEDEDLAVVDKPRGLVVHPAPGNARGTLVHALLARYGSLEGVAGGPADADAGDAAVRPGIVHRLDRDTTGLLLVARTRRAGLALRRQIAAREVARLYLAIAHGLPPERFTVDAPLGRAPDGRRMEAVEGGRPARTHAALRERFPGPPACSLLELRLETGRTHQIRVHLAAAGYPVAGDALYGQPERDAAAGLHLAGQALHAWRLRFRHPADGREVTVEAAPPPDFLAALTALRGR